MGWQMASQAVPSGQKGKQALEQLKDKPLEDATAQLAAGRAAAKRGAPFVFPVTMRYARMHAPTDNSMVGGCGFVCDVSGRAAWSGGLRWSELACATTPHVSRGSMHIPYEHCLHVIPYYS